MISVSGGNHRLGLALWRRSGTSFLGSTRASLCSTNGSYATVFGRVEALASICREPAEVTEPDYSDSCAAQSLALMNDRDVGDTPLGVMENVQRR